YRAVLSMAALLKAKKQCTIALKIAIVLANAPLRQGVSLTAVSDQRFCLWIQPAFLKKLPD
ncbi:MAG: hypothetical protein IJX24_06530, partial [Oscillospiraceae bacterium]|nr:hypothetical protein [Oscillospiraceae bacterium]